MVKSIIERTAIECIDLWVGCWVLLFLNQRGTQHWAFSLISSVEILTLSYIHKSFSLSPSCSHLSQNWFKKKNVLRIDQLFLPPDTTTQNWRLPSTSIFLKMQSSLGQKCSFLREILQVVKLLTGKKRASSWVQKLCKPENQWDTGYTVSFSVCHLCTSSI